jgi:hypothetical protein
MVFRTQSKNVCINYGSLLTDPPPTAPCPAAVGVDKVCGCAVLRSAAPQVSDDLAAPCEAPQHGGLRGQ